MGVGWESFGRGPSTSTAFACIHTFYMHKYRRHGLISVHTPIASKNVPDTLRREPPGSSPINIINAPGGVSCDKQSTHQTHRVEPGLRLKLLALVS